MNSVGPVWRCYSDGISISIDCRRGDKVGVTLGRIPRTMAVYTRLGAARLTDRACQYFISTSPSQRERLQITYITILITLSSRREIRL